ncbi:MAG: hypothetical protein GY863_10870 [bacterium]|nr:hypothetical protein [bacterium]
MKRNITIVLLAGLVLFLIGCTQDVTTINIDYLGQEPPGMTPQLFAPGVISNPESVDFGITFSTDGNELYFTKFIPGNLMSIMVMTKEGNVWSDLVTAPFSGEYRDGTPFLTSDGSKLFFTSWRPLNPDNDPEQKPHIWMVNRTSSGDWAEPEMISFPVRSSIGEWNPWVVGDGALYFNGNFSMAEGSNDIYFSQYNNGRFTGPVNLGAKINSEFVEVEPTIAPDGSYMIFYSAGRPDQMGEGLVGDLYISLRQSDGSWSEAKNMGEPVNSASEENWPRISPDGKYIFYSSNRNRANHFADIYWIDAAIIEAYK